MQRFRVTIQFEYAAGENALETYGTTDPALMADIDADNFENDPGILFDEIAHDDYTVTVVPL